MFGPIYSKYFFPQQQNALGSSAMVKALEQAGAASKDKVPSFPTRFPGSHKVPARFPEGSQGSHKVPTRRFQGSPKVPKHKVPTALFHNVPTTLLQGSHNFAPRFPQGSPKVPKHKVATRFLPGSQKVSKVPAQLCSKVAQRFPQGPHNFAPQGSPKVPKHKAPTRFLGSRQVPTRFPTRFQGSRQVPTRCPQGSRQVPRRFPRFLQGSRKKVPSFPQGSHKKVRFIQGSQAQGSHKVPATLFHNVPTTLLQGSHSFRSPQG